MLKIDIREWSEWMAKRFEGKDIITYEELLSDYEDLIFEVEHLKEELKDLKQDIEDNYRPIPPTEMYGISDRDFI